MATVNNVNLRIFNSMGQTRTQFGVRKGEAIVFHNQDPTQQLTIALFPSPALLARKVSHVLLEHGDPVTSPFTVAKSGSRTFTINSALEVGDWFKYSAEIAGAAIEDPIIIVEN